MATISTKNVQQVRSSEGLSAPELLAQKEAVLSDITRLDKEKATATEIMAKKEQLDNINKQITEIEISVGKPVANPNPIQTYNTLPPVQIEQQAYSIAQEMVKQIQQQSVTTTSGRVFTRFDYGTDVVENQQDVVTAGVWSGGIGTLTSFYTSSEQTAVQKQYYYDVYQSASSAVGAEPQFSVTYGNRK